MIARKINPPAVQLEVMSTRAWVAAGAIVGLVYAAGFALAMTSRPEEDLSFDSAGVVTFELSPIATSVAQDNPDLAPGRQMQQAVNNPESSKAAEQKPEEVPEVDKAPLAPEPEVMLPELKPEVKKVEEKPPEEKADRDVKSDPSVGDPVTSAPAKTEAPVARETTAPVAGTDRSELLAQATWQKSLVNHLGSHKRYPVEARARGEQGATRVQFHIDRAGKVVDALIIESSGSSRLDEEALAVLKRASPLPAPPPSIPGETIALILPIQFHIK